MREFAVPVQLQRHVAHLMAYAEELPPDVDVTERVLPDGALRLVFDLRDGHDAARVCGPSTSPVLLTMRGHVRGLSVTLRSGAALALFGLPAHELAGRAEAWEDLVHAGQRSLGSRLREARDDGARVRVLTEVLQAMLRETDAQSERRARLAAALFRRSTGERSVRAVAQALGIGERRLQQIFQCRSACRRGRSAGWPAHARMLAPAASSTAPWAQVAVEGGFYDQAHLVDEFRALCGLTPRQFLQRSISRSSKTPG